MKTIIKYLTIATILLHTTLQSSNQNPYSTTSSFESVQQKAQLGNFKEILPLIFQNKINAETINVTDSKDSSLLYWTVYYNNLMITDLLISAGAIGILIAQDNDISPLELAIKNKNIPIIKSLISRELIGDRANLIDLLKTTSSSADYNLINTINNSSNQIKQLFENVTSIFNCDQPENEPDLEYITKEPYDNPESPVYCFMLKSKMEALSGPLNIISGDGTITNMQVKIFLKNAPQNYYIELYNAESEFVGVTNFNETNKESLINFYTNNNQLAAALSFKNLNETIEAIKKGSRFETFTAYEASYLCSLSAEGQYPININNETAPFDNLVLYTSKDSIITKAYLNAVLINLPTLNTSNISISSTTEKESFNDFIKNHFTKKNILIQVIDDKEPLTILEPNNTYSEPYYFSLNQELCTIKTKNNEAITLLGSTVPFDQITLFSNDGAISVATYKEGGSVIVDNFDYDNILVTSNTTTTLTQFIQNNKFKGTFFIDAAPPIFSIKTNKNQPIIIGSSTTPFNEIKYFKINEAPTINAYMNNKIVAIDFADLMETIVVNQKNNSSKNLSEYLDEGIFTDPCFITVKSPLMEIYSIQKKVLEIIGMNEEFNQIKINYPKNTTDSKLKISYFLNEQPVEINNPITKNIIIIDANKNKKTFNIFLEDIENVIKDYSIDIKNNNASNIIIDKLNQLGFKSPYYIESNPEIFSLKSKDGNPLKSLSASITFNEIKYVISNGEGTVYPYLNNNPITEKDFNPSDITVVNNDNNQVEPLNQFIEKNNYTGKYYIAVGSLLFDIKKESKKDLKILGTSGFFDEIKGFFVNGIKTPYPYRNGSPVNIENFDPENVTVKNSSNGTSETLKEFIAKNNFNGLFTITETPPIFDIKSEKNIPIKLLGSSSFFDEIKYFKLNGILAIHTYLNGKEVVIDNFDADNIIINSQGIYQTLTSFIQAGSFKELSTMTPAQPIFDIKTEKDRFININKNSEKFNQVKYFKLNGEFKIAAFTHGAENKSITIDPKNTFVYQVDSPSNLESLEDFIAKGDFTKKMQLALPNK